MSRKVPGKNFPYEQVEEKETQRKARPGFVPWSNPTERQATDRSTMQGKDTPGTRCAVSSTRHRNTSPGAEALRRPGRHPPVFVEEPRPGAVSPGAEALSRPGHPPVFIKETFPGAVSPRAELLSRPGGTPPVFVEETRPRAVSPRAEPLSRPRRHPPVFAEETRPGVILVPGIDDDGLPIEEGYDDQATVASHEDELTIHVIARAVDTEEESQMRHELEQLRQLQIRHERDQLRQILDNAVVVNPVIATNRDVENGDKNIHVDNQDGSPRSEDPKCGTINRGRQWFAIGAILLIVVAVAVALALALPSEPSPNPNPPGPTTPPTTPMPTTPTTDPLPEALDELLASISSNSLTGTIPTEIGMLSDSLTEIWLFEAGLTGTIPSEVGQLTKLTYLYLGSNNLSGMIPSEIGMLSNSLEFLSIWREDALEGTIPRQVGQLTKLTYLSLVDTTLSGTIPSGIDSLANLDNLYLYGNNFTGNYTCPDFINSCGISCDPTLDASTEACRSL